VLKWKAQVMDIAGGQDNSNLNALSLIYYPNLAIETKIVKGKTIAEL
jgi:hypothetical protein